MVVNRLENEALGRMWLHADTSCRMCLEADVFDLREGISTVLKDKLVV